MSLLYYILRRYICMRMASESGASHVAASVAALGSIAGCIRTLLGPQGTLKLAHADSRDGVLLTGDALTVLDRLDVAHPAGTLLIEACEGLISSHGCGITTLACLTGELAKAALRLQQQVSAQHTSTDWHSPHSPSAGVLRALGCTR